VKVGGQCYQFLQYSKIDTPTNTLSDVQGTYPSCIWCQTGTSNSSSSTSGGGGDFPSSAGVNMGDPHFVFGKGVSFENAAAMDASFNWDDNSGTGEIIFFTGKIAGTGEEIVITYANREFPAVDGGYSMYRVTIDSPTVSTTFQVSGVGVARDGHWADRSIVTIPYAGTVTVVPMSYPPGSPCVAGQERFTQIHFNFRPSNWNGLSEIGGVFYEMFKKAADVGSVPFNQPSGSNFDGIGYLLGAGYSRASFETSQVTPAEIREPKNAATLAKIIDIYTQFSDTNGMFSSEWDPTMGNECSQWEALWPCYIIVSYGASYFDFCLGCTASGAVEWDGIFSMEDESTSVWGFRSWDPGYDWRINGRAFQTTGSSFGNAGATITGTPNNWTMVVKCSTGGSSTTIWRGLCIEGEPEGEFVRIDGCSSRATVLVRRCQCPGGVWKRCRDDSIVGALHPSVVPASDFVTLCWSGGAYSGAFVNSYFDENDTGAGVGIAANTCLFEYSTCTGYEDFSDPFNSATVPCQSNYGVGYNGVLTPTANGTYGSASGIGSYGSNAIINWPKGGRFDDLGDFEAYITYHDFYGSWNGSQRFPRERGQTQFGAGYSGGSLVNMILGPKDGSGQYWLDVFVLGEGNIPQVVEVFTSGVLGLVRSGSTFDVKYNGSTVLSRTISNPVRTFGLSIDAGFNFAQCHIWWDDFSLTADY